MLPPQPTNSELLVAHGYGRCSYISRVSMSAIPGFMGDIEADTLPRVAEIDRLIRIPGPNVDLFLLATSRAGFTVTLHTEDIIENVSEVTDFQTDYTTLLAGPLKGNLVYQVTSVCIRVLTDKGRLVKEFPKTWTVQAASYKCYFSLLLADGFVETTKIDIKSGLVEVKMPPIPEDPEIMSIDITAINRQKIVTLARADGTLQVYDVKKGAMLVCYSNAGEGLALLGEKDAEWLPLSDTTQKVHASDLNIAPVDIREIALRQFGPLIVLLLRVARCQVFIYTHFGPPLYRFQRISSSLYMGEVEAAEEPIQAFFQLTVGHGIPAFLVLHPRQCFWVIPDARHNTVYIHSSFREQPQAFSPLNYVDSEEGFIHLSKSQLVLTRLDDDLAAVLPSEALALRIPFLDTPRKLVLFHDMVFASFFVEDERGVVYSIRCFLLTPGRSLSEVCNIPRFSQNEIVLDICVVNFTRKLMAPTLYFVVATALSGPEDVECKGRLLLFSFENRALVQDKVEYRPTLTGAITAVAELDGYLLAAVSFEVKLFSYVEESEPYLEEIAFYRSAFLCVQFSVFQNYALCVDVRKSVYILGYREAHNQREMLLLGAYPKEHNCLSSSFILLKYAESEEYGVRALACDDYRNIYILDTVPWTEKMEKVGEFHTGLCVFSHAVCGPGRILCAREGVLAWLTPMPAHLFKEMLTLQNAMFELLPGRAALNARAYRHPVMHDRERQWYQADGGSGAYARGGVRGGDRERQRKSVLDRNLVLGYCYLSAKLQNVIGRNIGATPSHILPEIGLLATAQDFI